MNRMKTKKWMYVLLLSLCSLSASGCGNTKIPNNPADSFYERSAVDERELSIESKRNLDKIYNDAYERTTNPDAAEKMEGTDIFDKVMGRFIGGYYKAYRTFRSLSPTIIGASLIAGCLMMTFSRKNKKNKKAGLTIFIIGIPVAVVIAVFGIGILNGILLY